VWWPYDELQTLEKIDRNRIEDETMKAIAISAFEQTPDFIEIPAPGEGEVIVDVANGNCAFRSPGCTRSPTSARR
jgi:hypothetical protein